MFILETLGSIAYGLKNRFDQQYLANIVYVAVMTTQLTLKFNSLSLIAPPCAWNWEQGKSHCALGVNVNFRA
jgi:hypothetical protein